MAAARPALIGVDWGTTSLRAYLIAHDGAILDRSEAAAGILSVEDGRFAETLAASVGPWRAGATVPPILLSGMIGSRQGWREAPYVATPATGVSLARGLLAVPAGTLGTVHIVPGVEARDSSGDPDVMRGEETQILGALALQGGMSRRLVLPGTHSKWVTIENGAITAFTTYMTGELYAALKGHTILGRMMTDGPPSERGFLAGIAAARAAQGSTSLIARLFKVRTLGLFGRIAPEDAADYLSGLLIAEELLDARPADPVTAIGSQALVGRYQLAAKTLGITVVAAPPDCAAAGQFTIARAASLITTAAAPPPRG